MYALMDKAMFIKCRSVDVDLVETAAKEAATEFEKNAGYPVETEIDLDSPLDSTRYVLTSASLTAVPEG